jgi:hypothetical protein
MNAHYQHELVHKIRFLTGLNDSFDLVRSQILLMDPLPPLNKIFSHVIQYEHQFAALTGNSELDKNEALINATDSRKFQDRGKASTHSGYPYAKKSNRQCSYCGKRNHTVENCFKKHGFPPNFGKTAQANQANAEDQVEFDETKSFKGNESYGLTKDQYDKFVHMLQVMQAGPSTSTANAAQVNVVQHHHLGIAYSLSNSTHGSWIIDSGASDHVCSSLSCFDKYYAITPI